MQYTTESLIVIGIALGWLNTLGILAYAFSDEILNTARKFLNVFTR